MTFRELAMVLRRAADALDKASEALEQARPTAGVKLVDVPGFSSLQRRAIKAIARALNLGWHERGQNIYFDQLLDLTADQLRSVKNCGEKSLDNIRDFLRANNMRLKNE